MKRQYYRNIATTDIENQDFFMLDWEVFWDYIEEEFNLHRESAFNKGVVSNCNLSTSDNIVLEIDTSIAYLNGEFIQITSGTTVLDLGSTPLADNTYNVYINIDYEYNTYSYGGVGIDRYKTNHYNKTPIASFVIDTATHSDKVYIGSVTVASNLITLIDNTNKENFTNQIISDSTQTTTTTWSSQKIVDYLISQLSDVSDQIISDSTQTTTTTWSSQKIVDYLISQLSDVSDPVINTLDTPPSSPSDNDRYIVGSTPTGAWVGYTDYIAQWNTELNPNAWSFTAPTEGLTVYHQTFTYYVVYHSSSWVRFETIVDIDSIPDGTTYGKIKITQSNHVLFSSGDLSLRSKYAGFSNLNDITDTGWYHGNNFINEPAVGYYYIAVITVDNNYSTQFAYDVANNRMFKRNKQATVWQPWIELPYGTDGTSILNTNGVLSVSLQSKNVSGTNLNSLVDTGWYYGTSLTNTPYTSGYTVGLCYIEVIKQDANNVVQILYEVNRGIQYKRFLVSSIWSVWYPDKDFYTFQFLRTGGSWTTPFNELGIQTAFGEGATGVAVTLGNLPDNIYNNYIVDVKPYEDNGSQYVFYRWNSISIHRTTYDYHSSTNPKLINISCLDSTDTYIDPRVNGTGFYLTLTRIKTA